MTLTDTKLSLITQALSLAATRYVELADESQQLPGGLRLAEQFRRQAIDTRTVAILLGDAEEVTLVGVGREDVAHEEARKITAREVIDVRRRQNPNCPHCESPLSEEGCSNPTCEACA